MTNENELHIIDVALANGTYEDEPALIAACMRLSKGSLNPALIIEEIARRGMFRSPHPTWGTVKDGVVRIGDWRKGWPF